MTESEDDPGRPTLARFENHVNQKDLLRLSRMFVDLYCTTHTELRKRIIIGMDGTDDPTHGLQQLSMFHGYYRQYMYRPFPVFRPCSQ